MRTINNNLNMNIAEYIADPSLLDENSIIDLTLITEKYPYFQTGQLLRIKNLYNLSPEAIKPVLNYTAAYVTDRKILYYLLHPIAVSEQEVNKNPEKDIKDSIEENIADTMSSQIDFIKKNKDDSLEFTASLDVKKEYGEGVELDDYVVRINDSEDELIELIEEKKEDALTVNTDSGNPIEPEPIPQAPNPEVDILLLINKGVSADKVANKPANDLSESQKRNNSIIESFIQSNPKITPDRPAQSEIVDFSKDSVKESDHLITDTLAEIYLKQGNYAKAIFAYEKLSLKYPEKNAYFAGQIKEIKKLIEKK